MAYDLADVRAHLLAELFGDDEIDLGTGVLKVEETQLGEVWAWDYADSMTHDFGIVRVDQKGELNVKLHPKSASYSEGWTPND